ncbi:DUF2267 domain-containing protein [Micromonospora sp. B11E3]|uniref:DUF2267 domain-containing protein n=1 Tax=Micromonospora sp. B11E3 TaxID=3153562 RepID=UPI00325C50B3
MNSEDFIGSVAKRARTSAEQAADITRATLTTLAERIDGGEARDLADQLPEDLRGYAFAATETAEKFGRDVFVERVSGRAGVDVPLAEAGVRAVFDTLREAVTPGQYSDAVAQLPSKLWDLVNPSAPYVERSSG